MTPKMKRLRELRDRQSRERGRRWPSLAVADGLTDEQRSELDTIERGTPDLESARYSAATASRARMRSASRKPARPPSRTPSSASASSCASKASLANYLLAAARGRMVDGRRGRTVRRRRGVGGIPIELWDVPVERREGDRETRDGDRRRRAPWASILDPDPPGRVRDTPCSRGSAWKCRASASGTFATGTVTGSAERRGARQERAGRGNGGRHHGHDRHAEAGERPGSNSRWRTSRPSGKANFESILRENLSLALSDELDKQGLNGNGTSPNLTGMFQRLTDPAAAPAAVSDFDAFAAAHAGGVDGLWATTIRDVGIVVGPATYKLSARTFQTATNYKGELSAAAYALANAGGWWTNKRMPDADTFMAVDNVQQAILYRKGRSMMGGSGAMRTAVCPHWNSIDIDDIYSGSARGERYFTMHVLLGDVILVQPDAYEQIAYRVA